MSSSEGPDIDPKAVVMYAATLAGVALFSWAASRIGRPRPNPWVGETPER